MRLPVKVLAFDCEAILCPHAFDVDERALALTEEKVLERGDRQELVVGVHRWARGARSARPAQNAPDSCFEVRQFGLYDIPDDRIVDAVVTVDQTVPKPNDRMGIANLVEYRDMPLAQAPHSLPIISSWRSQAARSIEFC
jgi:hypothetical protein